MSESVLEAQDLSRTYQDGDLHVEVLSKLNFKLLPSSRVAIVGASGSGKSTLLNLLGGLDAPSTGRVLMQGQDVSTLAERERSRLRNQSLGFVYQFHHLLPEFSALENVAMPLLISGEGKKQSQAAAADLLDRIGLGARLAHRPSQLSGGERQRVAIARALIMRPCCVLMDEPTGNLDPAAAAQVLTLIDQLKRDSTTSFVIVTHDHTIAAQMDECFVLANGALERN